MGAAHEHMWICVMDGEPYRVVRRALPIKRIAVEACACGEMRAIEDRTEMATAPSVDVLRELTLG